MTTLYDLAPMIKSQKPKKGRKPKARPIKSSRKIEIEYTVELLAISALCKQAGNETLLSLSTLGAYLGDSSIGDAPWWLTNISNKFKLIGKKIVLSSQAIAEKITKKQARETQKQLAEEIKRVTTIDVTGIIKRDVLNDSVSNAITVNMSLIKSIPLSYQQKLESLVMRKIQEGKGFEWLEEEIRKLDDMTDNRAKLIARDQIGKLNSEFNRISQTSIGIDYYIWDTRRDIRVRGNPLGINRNALHSHYKREATRIPWNDPPPDGHAGFPINCRCESIPDLSDFM